MYNACVNRRCKKEKAAAFKQECVMSWSYE
jgi:hypothetical protein